MSKTSFDNYAQEAQKNLAEHTAQMSARLEDMAEFAKGNMDAFIASATKATESMKEISSEMLGYAKASMDHNVTALRELSQAKDASEFMEKQTVLAKQSMESFAKQAQKLNEMTMAAAKECAEPVNARMAAVSDLMKSGVAKA